MSFLEVKFPDSISFNSSSILEFNTSVVQSKSGLEQRNINWNSNKMKFNVVNGIKSKKELDEIVSFFRNVKGKAYGFRFKDWSDYQAKNEYIGVGDGEKTEFQLIKSYKIGNDFITNRKITKPVFSSIKIFVDDILNNDFNIDLTSGLITFNNPPPLNSTIKADFEFDIPVRFDSDLLEISMNSINSGNIKEISLIEI